MRALLPLLLLVACSKEPPTDPQALDPGRVTLHRLNRAEYDNTVRDLFGTDLRPARDFPADDFGYGFDNIADVLSLSPLHLELYERAADALVADLFGHGDVPAARVQLEAESGEIAHDLGGVHDATAWSLWGEGALAGTFWAEHTATHRVEVRAFGQQAGDEPVAMALEIDGEEVAVFDVVAVEDAPETHAVEVELAAGRHEVAVRFLNDLKDPALGLDRNLVVDWLAVEGPVGLPREPSPGRHVVLVCDPFAPDATLDEAACAERILWTFAERAWRRPITAEEFRDKIAVYAATRNSGGDWEEAVGNTLKAVLLSPDFIYRVEIDPDPTNPVPHPLSGWELASRLSYFLWSSMPDARLRDLARSGALADPEVLALEARRMLDDPKAEALVENLAGQWLYIRALDETFPDTSFYPAWDDGLRASMKDEMRLFVGGILLEDRSMLDLLTAEETWVDERLAAHYELHRPDGDGFVRVDTAGTGRRGLLTQGGLLTALSHPTRTSPVKRGVWVLGNLLCAEPPPPPPGVEGLDDQPGGQAASVREQMEQHRADPTCASCHATIDPIGFSMEHFDAVGRYRDVDEQGFPVDATGELPGVGPFQGVDELTGLLAADPRVPACMVSKVYTYALGRAPGAEDALFLEDIEARFAASGHRFEELVVAIVTSPSFRWRRGEP